MNKTLQGVAFGTALALGIMLILSFIASLLIYYTSISQQSLTLAAAIINSLALFCGGFAAGRKSGAKGLIQGLIVGTIVVIIMMLLGGITAGFLPRLSYCLIAAMIGGIFGVK